MNIVSVLLLLFDIVHNFRVRNGWDSWQLPDNNPNHVMRK